MSCWLGIYWLEYTQCLYCCWLMSGWRIVSDSCWSHISAMDDIPTACLRFIRRLYVRKNHERILISHWCSFSWRVLFLSLCRPCSFNHTVFCTFGLLCTTIEASIQTILWDDRTAYDNFPSLIAYVHMKWTNVIIVIIFFICIYLFCAELKFIYFWHAT